MQTSWWYILDGAQHGPVSSEALHALIHQQHLMADTLVWRAEFADWRRIADIPELTRLLPAYSQKNLATPPEAWWYALDGNSQGPVDIEALQLLFLDGRLNGTTLVWTASMADWAPAETVPPLQAWLPLSPEPPPAPALSTAPEPAPADGPTYVPSDVPSSAAAAQHSAHPWRRFFARVLDIYLFLVPLMFFSGFILSSYLPGFAEWVQTPESLLPFMWLLLPVVMLIEACIYALFGTTVGKTLFGIRVTSDGTARLSAAAYGKRLWRVYWFGLATGFPLIHWIALLRQYWHCKKQGQTGYDQNRYTVVLNESSPLRMLFGLALLGVLFFTLWQLTRLLA